MPPDEESPKPRQEGEEPPRMTHRGMRTPEGQEWVEEEYPRAMDYFEAYLRRRRAKRDQGR